MTMAIDAVVDEKYTLCVLMRSPSCTAFQRLSAQHTRAGSGVSSRVGSQGNATFFTSVTLVAVASLFSASTRVGGASYG